MVIVVGKKLQVYKIDWSKMNELQVELAEPIRSQYVFTHEVAHQCLCT